MINSETEKPRVILLQETLTMEVTFTGYKAKTHRNKQGRGITILIGTNMPYIRHETHHTACYLGRVTIKIILNNHVGNKQSIFLINFYSSPKDTKQGSEACLARSRASLKIAP